MYIYYPISVAVIDNNEHQRINDIFTDTLLCDIQLLDCFGQRLQ